MIISFESRFTAVADADDRFMHFTKCVTAGIGIYLYFGRINRGRCICLLDFLDRFIPGAFSPPPTFTSNIYEGAIDLSDLILILHQ